MYKKWRSSTSLRKYMISHGVSFRKIIGSIWERQIGDKDLLGGYGNK